MRSALRGHENPALDCAVFAAHTLQVSLLVLLHIEGQYPHATARRQAFVLQGAQSVQAELEQLGVPLHVHMERGADSPEVQLKLARRASLVIAEEPFCVPWIAGVERLCAEPHVEAPVWLMDCSSVVPSALVPAGACHRAYAFEQATRHLHAEHVIRPWPMMQLPLATDRDRLLQYVQGLQPSIDIISADVVSLASDMNVDASVPPVTHTIGGSAAGYARWNTWLEKGGLRTYARRRNDSLDVHAVSRMSAYLNLGMVSPFRVAREASAARGSGKSKFLQEFLTWRGLAFAHCYHFPMPATGATLAQLPLWAQQTLRRHAHDSRKVIPLERLAAGQSGDRGWDGMQRYLTATGELHNNARMGWGKAVVKWAASPEEALDTLLELNNRFALDGHAPPSYGGVLGCLGLFEGPGKSENAVVGRVSFRPPKPRYAAMQELAKELLGVACEQPHRTHSVFPPQRGPKPEAKEAGHVYDVSMPQELQVGVQDLLQQQHADVEPRKRRCFAQLHTGSVPCIDLT
jgi:deoxyribodipyrimidine photolyase